MARKKRDYKAEYARRVQRERERATAEGREFSLTRARGHGTREKERELRSFNKLIEDSRFGLTKTEWRDDVKQTVALVGRPETVRLLRDKIRADADKDYGRRRWEHLQATMSFLPQHIMFYQPGGSGG